MKWPTPESKDMRTKLASVWTRLLELESYLNGLKNRIVRSGKITPGYRILSWRIEVVVSNPNNLSVDHSMSRLICNNNPKVSESWTTNFAAKDARL